MKQLVKLFSRALKSGKASEEHMKTFALVAAAAALFVSVAPAQTSTAAAANTSKAEQSGATSNEEANIRAYVDLLRRDVKNMKTQIMGDVMQLDADDAAKFWPVYKDFEAENALLGNQIVAIVRTYAENYGKMTDATADQIATRLLTIEPQQNALKRKYYDRMKRELGAITATRFLQVENQLERLIELQIASQLPVISQ
jgi:hypothetical protein